MPIIVTAIKPASARITLESKNVPMTTMRVTAVCKYLGTHHELLAVNAGFSVTAPACFCRWGCQQRADGDALDGITPPRWLHSRNRTLSSNSAQDSDSPRAAIQCLNLDCPRYGSEVRMVAFVIQGITVPRILAYIGEPTQASIAEPAGWPPDGGQASELGLGWERRISPSRSSSSISASVGRLRWRRG